MTKKIVSIIVLVHLLIVLYFIFPDNLYLDYYLNYIKTANDPLLDWFVIMMGGISVKDTSMLLIVTVIAVCAFALFVKKDKDGNDNIKVRHVVYGVLSTAVFIRITFFVMFIVNDLTCDKYNIYKTQIKDISRKRISVSIDNIPLTKRITGDEKALATIGDTIELSIGKGCIGYYSFGKDYKINFSKKKEKGTNAINIKKENTNNKKKKTQNSQKENKAKTDKVYLNSIERRISKYDNEKLFRQKFSESITQGGKSTGTLSFMFIVDNKTSKHIKKIDIYRCPIELNRQHVCDFIEKSEEIKLFDNGTYLFVTSITKGYAYDMSLIAINSKEDFELLMFEYLYTKMPSIKGLRGSAFIDITIKPDGMPEASITQGLNPKVDKVALEFVKSIPWQPSQKGRNFRLTIMYAKGNLWQVKIWNMDV